MMKEAVQPQRLLSSTAATSHPLGTLHCRLLTQQDVAQSLRPAPLQLRPSMRTPTAAIQLPMTRKPTDIHGLCSRRIHPTPDVVSIKPARARPGMKRESELAPQSSYRLAGVYQIGELHARSLITAGSGI